MPETSYPFETSVEFTTGIYPPKLAAEIEASIITRALDRVDTGLHDFGGGDVAAVFVVFKDELTAADETELYGDTVPASGDSIVGGHDPTPPAQDEPQAVSVEEVPAKLLTFSPAEAGLDPEQEGYDSKRRTAYAEFVDTTTREVRATAYTPDGVNAQRSFVSDDAADTSAGTGARKVRLVYYDEELSGPKEEVVTLNGTTPVNTGAEDVAFVELIEVVEVGGGGANAGAVSLKAGAAGAGATVASIAAGDNRTYSAHHYIGQGRSTKVTDVVMGTKSSSESAARLDLACKDPTQPSAPQVTLETLWVGGTNRQSQPYAFPLPVTIDGPAVVFVNLTPEDATGGNPLSVHGSFGYYEETPEEELMAVQTVAAPTPPNNNLARSLFVWTANNGSANDILDTDAKIQDLLDHCATYGINVLFFDIYAYLSKANWTGARQQRMQLLVERAHQSGIQVYALAGNVDWGVNHKWVMENIILYLRRYQDQATEQQRFSGVILDVEYWTDEGTYPAATNVPGLLDLVRRFRDHLQVPVGIFAAFYLVGNGNEVAARTNLSYRGISAQDGEHMCDHCDFIVVGAYDDLAAGQDNRFQSWYDYATATGTDRGKNVGLYLGSETLDDGGLAGISWWQEGRAAMEAAHTTHSGAFFVTGNSCFLGHAIHDYEHHSSMGA